MKKILVLDTGKEWGGGTNSLLELLRRIDKSTYSFSALFYENYKRGNDSDIKTEIEKLGIQFQLIKQVKPAVAEKIIKEIFRNVLFFSKNLKRYFLFFVDYQTRIKKNAAEISKIIKSKNIDLLYMNNQPSSNLEGIIAAKITHIPAIQHSRIEAQLNSLVIKNANQGLARIICVSEGVKNNLLQQRIEPSKCVVVYNGIDPETKPSISSQEIKSKWGISDDYIVIGTVGSLIKRKRISDLIDALHIAAIKTDCRIKCLIVGEGHERNKLLKLVNRKNLNGKVILTGFQSDAISYINAMDIFIMTSEKEGLPRVILEAMLMAKPVIASRIGGAAELIINRKTGLLFEKYNTKELADCILSLLSSKQIRNDMGKMGHERVIDNYSIETYARNVQSNFKEILE
ncbi:MAG: glycosyltransferase family 4 protein [Nitrospirae bacterium]|nr:glycosyltransferase family 4 protein [Nitrospirota bacterium]